MKYLRIKNGSAEIKSREEYKSIEKTTKEDLMFLINEAVNPEADFEMDTCKENDILNPAHKIIYENLYEKLQELLSNRERFREECRQIYKSAREKYAL